MNDTDIRIQHGIEVADKLLAVLAANPTIPLAQAKRMQAAADLHKGAATKLANGQ